MVSGPLAPGVFTAIAARLSVELEARAIVSLNGVGLLVEDRAIQSISARSHAYRTPTPASRGGPPAMVSGTLAGSITHDLTGLSMRVGTAAGRFPPYGKGRTPSSLYGLYLEKLGAGINHITYPFLKPAFEAVRPGMSTVVRAAFVGFGAG
ncbi:MAG: hypothetical protein JWO67_3191 [Streptosporangiaceae bacterium]|nr:hypothetical protein [Streptosporangiaceae bacterium]